MHNWHKANNYSVKEMFETDFIYNDKEWESEEKYREAIDTNELWSMHWALNLKEPSDDDRTNSLYAPTFLDLMRLIIIAETGSLVEYN
jgi:hypothetical protein